MLDTNLHIVILYVLGLGFLAGLLGCALNAFVKSIFK
jgi:energy-converting hydrogenase Eha subunit A